MANVFIKCNYPYDPTRTVCYVSVTNMVDCIPYNTGSRVFYKNGNYSTLSQTPAQVQSLVEQSKGDPGYASGTVTFTNLQGNKHTEQVDEILCLSSEEPNAVYQFVYLGGTIRMRETPSGIFAQMKRN